VTESIVENPGLQFAIVHELDISRNTMQRVLTKDLPLHAYKDQLTQEL